MSGFISIVSNIGFSLLLGRICVNEDFYDLLAQVITFHIFLKSNLFYKENKKKDYEMKIYPGTKGLREHS